MPSYVLRNRIIVSLRLLVTTVWSKTIKPKQMAHGFESSHVYYEKDYNTTMNGPAIKLTYSNYNYIISLALTLHLIQVQANSLIRRQVMWKGRQNVKNITYLHLYIHNGYTINYIIRDKKSQKRTSDITIRFAVGVNGFKENCLQDPVQDLLLVNVGSVLLDKVH